MTGESRKSKVKAVIFDMFETLVSMDRSDRYFSYEISQDLGLPIKVFKPEWNKVKDDCSTGKLTFEEGVAAAMKVLGVYSDEKLSLVSAKRHAAKESIFREISVESLNMLDRLKTAGYKLGLISNCFSEEHDVIRASRLYPFFDAALLSYEEGIQKPDPEIFRRCVERLGVCPGECLYIGDGGNNELEAAYAAGMNVLQAGWFKDAGPIIINKETGMIADKAVSMSEIQPDHLTDRFNAIGREMIALFSGFPNHHFSRDIVDRLKTRLTDRSRLVFISAWPEDSERNDADSAGMHGMLAECGLAFDSFSVIDERTDAPDAWRLIKEASCIWLMGGNPTAQMKMIREKKLADCIRECSAILLGVSAGSMNLSGTTVDIYESLTPYEGIGLTDYTLKSHYGSDNAELNEALMQLSMNMPVLALEDGSAIFIYGDRTEFIGHIYRVNKGKIHEITE